MPVGEWDRRQLCPDGTCIGVIGPEGTCKVCGRAAPNWGDERKRGLIDPPDDSDFEEEDLATNDEYGEDEDDDDDEDGDDGDDGDDDDDDDDEDGAQRTGGEAVAAAGRGEWTDRRL